MSPREHPTDRLVRQLPLPSDQQANRRTHADTRQAMYQQIMAHPSPDPTGPSGRRSTVLMAATLTLLTLAAAGWALVTTLEPASTRLDCHVSEDFVTGIESVTGDPIQDCAPIFEQQFDDPPQLMAYQTPEGRIAVAPADDDPPQGWHPIDGDATLDQRAIELRDALDDHIAGLPSRCHDNDEARHRVQQELDRLDLHDWTITTRGEPDGAHWCAYFVVSPEEQQVLLTPIDGLVPEYEQPHTTFANDLGAALAEDCYSAPEAASLAEQFHTEADLESVVIHTLADNDADCARAHVTVAARITVVIRGPTQ